MNGWQKATVTGADYSNGLITATLLVGPEIVVPFVGWAPFVGDVIWVIEVAPGAFMSAGTPGLSRFPCFRVTQEAAPQTLTNNTVTDIVYDTLLWEQALFPAVNAVPVIPSVPWAGLYYCVAGCGFVANATGDRLMQIQVNAVAKVTNQHGAANGTHVEQVAGTVLCAIGDNIRVRARQQSGGNLNTVANGDNTSLEVYYLGPQG